MAVLLTRCGSRGYLSAVAIVSALGPPRHRGVVWGRFPERHARVERSPDAPPAPSWMVIPVMSGIGLSLWSGFTHDGPPPGAWLPCRGGDGLLAAGSMRIDRSIPCSSASSYRTKADEFKSTRCWTRTLRLACAAAAYGSGRIATARPSTLGLSVSRWSPMPGPSSVDRLQTSEETITASSADLVARGTPPRARAPTGVESPTSGAISTTHHRILPTPYRAAQETRSGKGWRTRRAHEVHDQHPASSSVSKCSMVERFPRHLVLSLPAELLVIGSIPPDRARIRLR